ncbi:MAG TPA: retention module-containing protein [Pseudomonas sp.]
MARLMGTVRQVAGEVFAIAEDGSRRALYEGDRLFVGEQLQTGANGAVAVHLSGGGELTLGRDSRLPLTAQILANHATHVDTSDPVTPTLAQLTEVQPLQQAITAGADPTQTGEAPATGPASSDSTSGALGGGHSAVLLTETGGEVTPVIGFPTAGFNSVPEFPEGRIEGFRNAWPDTPPLSVPPVIEPPVPPPVEPPLEPPVVPPPPEPPVIPPEQPPVEPPVLPPEEPPTDHGVELTGGALTFNEANLPSGSASDGEALTQTGSFKVTALDGLQNLTVAGIVVVSAGVVADFSQPVTTGLGNTFSVTGYDPDTGEVHYSYTLTGTMAHPNGDGANAIGELLSVVATDRDGDTANSALDITIVDDLPQAADLDVTVTTEPVCTNLLLIIDTSESMNDPSGVECLSRLALAKQAISELLDHYTAMGDVKVQVVAFNSQAGVLSDVWVDVATAKSLIDGLGAGNGTNYDAALAGAEAAFVTEGSISGAQNLAYFFSDGNPTLSATHSDPNHQPNPQQGDGIDLNEQAAWVDFLESHGINAFAIGLGTDVSSTYLDPIAHDLALGSSGAVIVTDLGQLSAVLAGTVQGGTSGSLLNGGTFGADGGFIQSITVDGTLYAYNPKTGAVSAEGVDHGSFNTTTHNLTVISDHGGTLVVNVLSGAFTYTPASEAGSAALTENIRYVISDNDGDLCSANLLIHVPGATAPLQGPVAVADHIITNVLSSSIEVPAALLLVNDVSANGDPLSATPGVFNTGWQARGEDFSAGCLKIIDFDATRDAAGNQLKTLERSEFFNNSAMTAMVVLTGYLGAFSGPASNAHDEYSVQLKAGETVQVDLHNANDSIGVAWQMGDGAFQALDANGTFTATEDNVYRILLVNQPDPGISDTGEHYTLNLSIDYSAVDTTATYESLYTVTDAHGASDSAAVSITYQEGCTLQGTQGDDVLVGGTGDDTLSGADGNDVLSGGAGNNDLYGDNGNDVLFSGPGNDVMDGGAGVNTVSYALAASGVNVTSAVMEAQHTAGAGTDTLINIQNLIGSNYDDHLTGDWEANVISGGQGNDQLIGAGGDDTLSGGAGNDTFKWLAGETGHDQVMDFSVGGDTLDLSQLLQGLSAGVGSLEDYLHFTVTGSGADVVSSIQVSSSATPASAQTIDLAGVDLATHYGVTPGSGGIVASGADTASIITGMLGDHSMKVDTV